MFKMETIFINSIGVLFISKHIKYTLINLMHDILKRIYQIMIVNEIVNESE